MGRTGRERVSRATRPRHTPTQRERERRMSSRSYDNPVQQVPSMAHEEPMRQRKVDTGFGHSTDDVEMEIAPLLHSEMEKFTGEPGAKRSPSSCKPFSWSRLGWSSSPVLSSSPCSLPS